MSTYPQTFQEILIQGVSKYPDRVALVSQGQPLTYHELAERSARVAEALQGHGIVQGDRVAVLLPNSWEFIVAAFGIVLAGGIVVPFNPTIPPGKFEALARDCGVRALFLDHELLPRLRASIIPAAAWQVVIINEVLQDSYALVKDLPLLSLSDILEMDPYLAIYKRKPPNPDVVVSITYTSGLSGEPNGVMHTHRSWLTGALYTSQNLRIRPQSKLLIPSPLLHANTFRHVLAYLAGGGTVILAADLLEGLKTIKKESPEALLLGPTDINLILDSYREPFQRTGSCIRVLSVGTPRISPEQIVDLQALFPDARVYLQYSLPEAPVGSLEPGPDPSLRVIKAIQPGLDVRVVDERGYHVTNGHIGEIVIRGAGLMAGYWGSTLGEARRYKQWGFATGDLGRIMPDGSIALLGRAREFLKVGGLNISLPEIERVIRLHPGVLQAAILSSAGPEGMQDVQLTAQVVLKKGVFLSAESLLRYCRERLEPYKVPAEIQFCSSLVNNG
jgi:acyl-CoA synthetase (AMP-forming)/AMP-acid ligase II